MTLAPNTVRTDEEHRLIRAAMSRLQENKAERSNGTRTVAALADESGIPRHRLYEHHSDLLNEYKQSIGHGPVAANVEALQRQLAAAHDHTQQLAAENAQLRAKIRTLAAVITELTHETRGAGTVVPIPRQRTRPNR